MKRARGIFTNDEQPGGTADSSKEGIPVQRIHRGDLLWSPTEGRKGRPRGKVAS